MGLPTPPSLGSFNLSKTTGLQVPGLSGQKGTSALPVVDPALNSELLDRKVQFVPEENWNAHIPYYFAVVQANSSGAVTSQLVDTATLSRIGLNTNVMQFNIAPGSLNVSNQFAINVSATNQGILEEHNGVVFRVISISGTTGVFPQKLNRSKPPSKALKIAQSLFPAATSAVVTLLKAPKTIAKAALGGKDNDLDTINSKIADGSIDLTQTGYYQFWQLHNFLIAYAEGKKGISGFDTSSLRLVFGSGKDNIGYVCTPLTFEMKRDVSHPLLYHYSITLKAWDMISALSLQDEVQADIPSPDNQSVVKALTDVLTGARSTIASARNVLSGVHSDLDSIINIGNQALLVYQDAAGIVTDVRTFGSVFTNNSQSLLLASHQNQNAMVNALNDPTERTNKQPPATASQSSPITKSANISAQTQTALQGAGFDTSKPVSQITPGGEDKADPEKKNIPSQAASLVNNALKTDTFLSKTLDSIDVPDQIQAGIDNFRSQSQKLTAGDIQTLANDLQSVSDNYAISLGAMDAVYAATYNLANPVTTSTRTPTEDDIVNEVAIQDTITSHLSTLATGQFFLERDTDPFLAANQSLQDIDQLPTPSSMFAVPFNRGSTMELMAQRYLGDASRAREIEVLNNLRAPYIDEIGFTVQITGASGRTFVVGSSLNLTIGQSITLQGTGAPTSRRSILNIENIGGGESRVSVDGLPNLDTYVPSTHPHFQAFLPGTVGPGDTLLIPSQNAPSTFAATRPTQLFNRLTHAEQVFKVDMALDTLNAQDLSISASGDIQLSFGYTNAVQALRLALEVERGELERHPNYGLPTPIGSRNSDISSTQAEQLIQSSITSDPRFVDADVNLIVDSDRVNVSVTAHGSQNTGQIPVTFEVGLL